MTLFESLKIASFCVSTVAAYCLSWTIWYGARSTRSIWIPREKRDHIIWGRYFAGFMSLAVLLVEIMVQMFPVKHARGTLFYVHLYGFAWPSFILTVLLVFTVLVPKRKWIGRAHYFFGVLNAALYLGTYILGTILLTRY